MTATSRREECFIHCGVGIEVSNTLTTVKVLAWYLNNLLNFVARDARLVLISRLSHAWAGRPSGFFGFVTFANVHRERWVVVAVIIDIIGTKSRQSLVICRNIVKS